LGSARFDEHQSVEDRHGFDNLILLCSPHHTVVDDDEEAYTVERLSKMKHDHESKQLPAPEVSEPQVDALLATVSGSVVTQGSIIVSQNQSGGQIAHSITNVGPPSRTIPQAAASALSVELSQYPTERILIDCAGDSEAFLLSEALAQLLRSVGWEVESRTSTRLPPVYSIIFEASDPSPGLMCLGRWCANSVDSRTSLRKTGDRNQIIVGKMLGPG
jgi:hypothetical protein